MFCRWDVDQLTACAVFGEESCERWQNGISCLDHKANRVGMVALGPLVAEWFLGEALSGAHAMTCKPICA